MIITQSQLLRAVPELYKPRLDEFVASLNQWAVSFGIDSPLRMAHYLAQVIHESQYLKRTDENLNYSADGLLKTFGRYFTSETAREYARQPERIANRVYASRMGNGPEASGDGWRYRGRGFIMLTGKENYERFNQSDVCTEDVIRKPDEVMKFPLNQVVAGWFWEQHDLNALADADDADAICRKINGGTNGLADRKFLLRRFKKEFGIK